MKTLDRHPLQTVDRQTHRSRSAVFRFGRFTEPLQHAEPMAKREDLNL
jgi:hypothetical protein